MTPDTESAPLSLLTQDAGRAQNQEADDLIRGVYEKRVAWSARRRAFEAKLHAAYACSRVGAGSAEAFEQLLGVLGVEARRSGVEPVIPHLGPRPGNTSLDALVHLALRSDEWIRSLEDWRAADGLPVSECVGDLARHLLACYEVPCFMDACWFEGFCPEGDQHRHWFRHIGVGGNVRTACDPVRMTKMAAHHFLLAPRGSSIVGAVRYGQVLGLGGDARLARAIAETKLGDILPDEPFWESVVHFFVNNPEAHDGRLGPIVDYLWKVRFGGGPVPRPGEPFHPDDALAPDLTMKGRTLAALWRRVQEWHEQLARDGRRPRSTWAAMGVEPFRLEERDRFGSLNLWTINELLSSQALMDEGREMHHCVFSYAPQCIRGSTSIFSLRVRSHGAGRLRRLLTIEVDRESRSIVQVRGKCNKTLGACRGGRMSVAGAVLRKWAYESRLTVRCSL